MKLRRLCRGSAVVLVSALVLATASIAAALPVIGMARPEVSLEDAWGHTQRLSQFRGKPILVVYEDKDSATQNQPLKDTLRQLAAGDRYRRTVALVAVADVDGYDYWPVRGFVEDAIQDESNKQGTTIYCDWDGHVRNALGLQRGASNVELFGKDGKLLFASSGALSAAQRAVLLALLRREVEG